MATPTTTDYTWCSMLMQVALGGMSVTWMSVVGILMLAQKVLPAKAAFDVPLALAIVGLGILIVVARSSVPGFIHRCETSQTTRREVEDS